MALVRKLSRGKKERHSVHEEVECMYSVFSDKQHYRYLQLDTFGKPTRKLKGKTSQAIQFDEKTLRELRRVIDSILG